MAATAGATRYRMRRAVCGLALTLAAFAAAGWSSQTAAEPREGAFEGRVVVVAEGETMWDLVLPFAPAGEDPHAWVAKVAEHNRIDPGRVRPGDALRIPAS